MWGKMLILRSFDKKTASSETNIIKELVPYIDAKFRTLRDPAYRMVKGFSMGQCLCMISVR